MDFQQLLSDDAVRAELVGRALLTVRDLISEASAHQQRGSLHQAVLDDPVGSAFSDDIRTTIGPDWLERNGIS